MKKFASILLLLLLVCGSALAATTLDGGADQASAVAVAVGESYIDIIDAGDSEWFTFTADQDGAYYRVNQKNEEINAWLNMAIYDEQNVRLFEDDVYTGKSQYYSWKVTPGMKYTIRMWSSDKKASGRVTLSVDKTLDEHGNRLESASALELNTEIISTLDGTGDADVFTFTTLEGSNYYRVDIKNNDLNAWLNYELLDANGLSVQKDDVYTNKSAYISWKAEPGAQYFIKLYSDDKKQCGKYALKLSCKADNEPNSMADGVALVEGQKVDGAFEGTGDVDYFTFTALEGSNYYRIDIKNNDLNAWLKYELLDANSLSVQKDDVYTNKSAYISWKAEPGAQYFIKLYSDDKKQYGKYTLSLSHAADNEPDTLGTALALTLGEKSASFDGTGDVDYYTFTAGAERAYYRLVLKNGTVDCTSYMELQDAAGLKIKTVEAGKNKTSVYSFAAEAGATYYLKLSRSEKSKLGDYIVTVEEYLDPMGDTPETALKLEDGVKAEGSIAGKEDTDFVSVVTGDLALIHLALENPSGNERMNVAVLDDSGKEVTSWRVDGGTTGEKTLELTPNTTYYVRVKCDKLGAFSVVYATLKDLGGSDIASAVAAQAGVMLDLAFEMKTDTDYIAFPEAGATLRVMATGEKNISVTIVDEKGMTLQNETRIYAGDSRVYVAERQGAYLKIMGDGGTYSVNCCTASQHVRSEYFETVKEPTCSEAGVKEMYCTVCNAVVDTQTIEMKAHTPSDSFHVSKKATCDEAGQQEKKCIRCGTVVETQEIPATGHVNTRWEIVLKDTCTENGIQRRVCSDCGKQLEQEIIPALGHVTSDWLDSKQATCTEDGLKVRQCRVCYAVLEEQVLPAFGHTAGDWKVSKYPTCAESGREVRVCQTCAAQVEEQVLPMLSHTYGEWMVVKEPTSTTEGRKERVCQSCGDTQSETIDKKGFFGGLFGN